MDIVGRKLLNDKYFPLANTKQSQAETLAADIIISQQRIGGLRRSQAQRIKAQQGPDGAAYPPRKKRKELKGKKGQIKRQKAAIFAKIRTTKFLNGKATGNHVEVGFVGRVARIARVHQFREKERISNTGRNTNFQRDHFWG